MTLPPSMRVDDVAEWLDGMSLTAARAFAVLALVESKVREACESFGTTDEIVSRVMNPPQEGGAS